MRVRTVKFITCLLLLGFFGQGNVFCADSPGSFEQALKNMEAQKAEERKALTLKYKGKLNQVMDSWLAQKQAEKNSQLNQVIDQNWDKLPYEYNFTTLHYDYYLRGFDYSILSSDIKETESLTSPIKAQVVIIEKVYAEKYHTPDLSNVDPYYFTVTTTIILNLEYRQDNFAITGTDSKITSIENNCPPRIKSYGRNLY